MQAYANLIEVPYMYLSKFKLYLNMAIALVLIIVVLKNISN